MADHVVKPEAMVPENYQLIEGGGGGCKSVTNGRKVVIPVVDLGGAVDAEELTNQILKAGKEFGCFQVVKHGISDELVDGAMGVAKEFFAMPAEAKAEHRSEDGNKMPLYSTSVDFIKSGEVCCREFFRFNCYPLHQYSRLYPDNPPLFRDIIGRFSTETRGLAMRLLGLVCRGLGLDDGYFDGVLRGAPIKMLLNKYPTCPDPSSMKGMPTHADTTIVTLILQRDVCGLQVLHGGDWVDVEPLPNALTVLYGLPMEFFTNGLLKAVEHRVVTNTNVPRTTVCMFVAPPKDCVVAPPQQFLTDRTPQLYRSFRFSEFAEPYASAEHDRERTLKEFAIELNEA